MFQLSDARKRLQAEARELAEAVFRGRAAEIDRTEEYPWDNVAALRDAGFFLALQPVSWGVYELDPQDFFRY